MALGPLMSRGADSSLSANSSGAAAAVEGAAAPFGSSVHEEVSDLFQSGRRISEAEGNAYMPAATPRIMSAPPSFAQDAAWSPSSARSLEGFSEPLLGASAAAPGQLALNQMFAGSQHMLANRGGLHRAPEPPGREGAAHSAVDDVAFLRGQANMLQAEVDTIRQEKVNLHKENSALEQELAAWRTTGVRLQEREGHIAKLLSQAASLNKGKVAVDVGRGKAGLAHSLWSRRAGEVVHLEAALVLIPVVIGLVAMFLVLHRSGKVDAELSADGVTNQASSRWFSYVGPVLRCLRIAPYKLQISEVVVCAPGSGDVRVRLQLGPCKELQTSAAHKRNGHTLMYPDVFAVPVQSSNGAAKFTLIDRESMLQEPLAQCEMPVTELLGLAHRQHGEYCRFPLQVRSPVDPDSSMQDLPYIAMRIRDISGQTPASEAAMAKAYRRKPSKIAL
eukprot:CAMPEP_0178451136 /NCGR_PEP_ID=MMETSP0689_2-20121128/43511_1 /TAXON_ID=160604 /ORGANISM="Amphidinium massartii, Strain CS-259" /LENGTH=446 /DNA_ID=CAMNT_0020076677 /DNA_START=50 /DNA_END=1391 /DNA_ORIENTATION=+